KYLSALSLAAITCFSLVSEANAQGCSDPGFCTIGGNKSNTASMVSDDAYDFDHANIGISSTFAQGEEGVFIISPQLETRLPINEMGYFDVKIPIVNTNGELGNITNLGDVLATYTHVVAGPNSYYG